MSEVVVGELTIMEVVSQRFEVLGMVLAQLDEVGRGEALRC